MPSIKLTKPQFLSLLKMVYLGNWMTNAHRVKDRVEQYEELESYFFSQAEKNGFHHLVVKDSAGVFPSREFEEDSEIRRYTEEYDTETFWSNLAEECANHKLRRLYSEEEFQALDHVQRFTLLCNIEEEFIKEFETNGLNNLLTEPTKLMDSAISP